MATLVLSAAGMALGSSVGGSIMGLSAAAIGRAAGAALGRRIDQNLLGAGSDPVETGRVDRFRLTGASEGAPLSVIHGSMRVPGQVIWASRFEEHVRRSGGGGKGGPPRPQVNEYSYTVSLAIALCAGEISSVGRVWADGAEVAPDSLNMQIYNGSDDQMPDPVMEAIEGAGNVPAYRGLAYVVFDSLDLTPFGARVPQFTFEVHRPSQSGDDGIAHTVKAVALIPGTGEYALATSPVALQHGFAHEQVVNVNSAAGKTDFLASMDQLTGEIPACGSVSLVVSWFGDDLRCGACRIRPKVEQTGSDAEAMPWKVGNVTRAAAGVVPDEEGRPIYGGTPADAAVIEAIKEMRDERGLDVMFYPFILMEQMAGNTLPNPWTGKAGQPVLPWRGRITTSLAPGQAGSVDGTAAARAEVDAFFDGPDGFRAFILHYARLCAGAGGVTAFCIGSEMRGLTQIRDDQGYPAVTRLRQLAAECRAILGAECKIGYAADWSEYHGHQPGNGDKIFHLDPLWADPAIDFVGIDNYMPLSDWRDGTEHADAHWGDVTNIDYLKANVAGGEMFDWYYPSPEARDAQRRVPITDGDGEPWVWRAKDLRGWWSHTHHNRIGGQRAATPTAWQPGMKPIWFTELGCAAVDRGTNQPNKFVDPKSSESSLPYYSRGFRDDYIQMQYLRAMLGYYGAGENNPVSPLTGQRMVDMSRAHVWAWDARPWPAFPGRSALWSDGANHARGHWLNGRASARPLSAVVAEICARAGVTDIDVSGLRGVVRGYLHRDTDTAREALQPLMLAHGFDAVERDGKLIFRNRDGLAATDLTIEDFALGEGGASAERLRAGEAEVSGRVRIGYIEAAGAYEARSSEAILPDEKARGVTGEELPMALTGAEAEGVALRWLSESRLARDRLRFALPPSRAVIGAGDVIRHEGANWRIDRVESNGVRLMEAVRVAPETYQPTFRPEVAPRMPSVSQPAPVTALFLDLPLMRGDEAPHAPHIAMTGRPWPGAALLQSANGDADYAALAEIGVPAIVGQTLNTLKAAPAGRWDNGPALKVRLVQGALESVSAKRLLGGANLAAIGDGSPDKWELFQFTQAVLHKDGYWELSLRLRGQGGTDGMMPALWPAGSTFVLLDARVPQLALPPASRGVARDYRYGPANGTPSDATWRHRTLAFDGAGLRPYPVCHLRCDGYLFRWIRRSRTDGDTWAGTVPLGEAREAYLVRVRAGGKVVREVETTVPQWAYAATDRLADGVSGAYAVEVAQLSDHVGPGPFRSITAVS